MSAVGRPTKRVSVSADGSKGVKEQSEAAGFWTIDSFSIRRWIEGCESRSITTDTVVRLSVSVSADGSKGVKVPAFLPSGKQHGCFSIRRWIEGCESLKTYSLATSSFCFSIRRWIEGCEAPGWRGPERCHVQVSVSADGSKGVKRGMITSPGRSIYGFQYPQMDRRV